MRGKLNAPSRSFEISLAYLHGRIEHEIETFADRLSVSPLELAARLGALLSNAGEWSGHQLPGLPLAPGGRWSGDPPPPALEGVIESHGGETPHQAGAQAGAVSKGQKISAASKAMWDRLTPRQRTEKTLSRYEAMKRHSPAQKKAMATLRAKLAGEKPSHSRNNPEKQALYLARYEARKKGLPLPPLPKEIGKKESKDERKRRLDRERHRARRDAQKAAAGKLKSTSKMVAAAKSAWSGMTMAQRQAEMKRRMQVAKKNRAKKEKAAGESVVWNKPGKQKQQMYVNAGAQTEVRPEAQEATGT
jgi:hypothetical protein